MTRPFPNQYPAYRRRVKIVSAAKYFRTANVDHRTITSKTVDWWTPDVALSSIDDTIP